MAAETGCRDRADRLTATMLAAAGAFGRLGAMPPGPDRERLVVAIQAYSTAAISWYKSHVKPRRPSRRGTYVTSGWVGC